MTQTIDEVIVPYNINNVLITERDIQTLFKKYNLEIKVNNLNLFHVALTHKSYVISEYTTYNHAILKNIKESMSDSVLDLMPESSERIEFFGDTVIKCIVSWYLMTRYTEAEGFLTKTKTKIENRKSLANFARKLGLDDYLIISKQNEDTGNRDSDKFLEDAFESFMGALLIDQGFDFCVNYMWKLLETEIDYAEILYIDTNFKDILQRFFHQNGWQHPVFEDISNVVIGNKKIFTVAVLDSTGTEISRGSETSKKKAEQKASMFALLKYGQLYADQIVEEFD
jgi:ribonuclease-3